MDTEYEYLNASKVQCPRCGKLGEIPLCNHTGYALEYAGVCETKLDEGGRCGTTLIFQVTAHLFPEQPA